MSLCDTPSLRPSPSRSHPNPYFKIQQAIEAVRVWRGHARQRFGEEDLVGTRHWRGEAAQVRKRGGREGEREGRKEKESGRRYLPSFCFYYTFNRHKENQRIRLLMRQEKTMKVRRPLSLPPSSLPSSLSSRLPPNQYVVGCS